MIGAGLPEPRIVARLDMPRRRESDHRGAGGARGRDTADTVLDHDAVTGLDAKPLGRVQEDVGVRFAARDIGSTEHPPLEQRGHVQDLET